MRKKELLKLPELKATKAMKEAADQDKGYRVTSISRGGVWVPNYIWYYRAKRTKDVLEIAIFTRKTIIEGCEYPRYRVFLHDGKYDTWDNSTEKWRTATIERLEYEQQGNTPEYYWYSNKGIWMREDEKKELLEYTDNMRKDPMAAVQYWENHEKNRVELDKIDAEMRLVPGLPKDFDNWILTDGIPQYIFYNAGRKVKEGYCTACKHTVQIQKPKYNKETICPHCGRKAVYKSRKKSGNIVDWGHVGLLQKTAEGFVYRYFKVRVKYTNGIRTESGCWEEIRQMYDKDFSPGNEFEFFQYKQTDMIRWCYKNWNLWQEKVREEPAILYWRNIKRTTKGTCLEYSALEIFARQKKRFYPENYIREYKYFKGIEQLVKCGFYEIAGKKINGSLNYIDESKMAATKILNLRKDYYRLLAGTDPTIREYYVTMEFQEVGIRPEREDITYLAEYGGARNFAVYIRHTTIHRMLRYLKENLKSNKQDIQEYHDYLQMAAGLGYDLDEEWILYPKDMKQRHAQYVEERREQDLKIAKMKDNEKTGALLETIKRMGWNTYEMERLGLFIRTPREASEIRSEGNALHHCVASYLDRMAGGKTCILFIRRKEEPEKPFYTMEVREGKIIQCRGKNNCDMTEEVQEFVQAFKRKKLRQAEKKAS